MRGGSLPLEGACSGGIRPREHRTGYNQRNGRASTGPHRITGRRSQPTVLPGLRPALPADGLNVVDTAPDPGPVVVFDLGSNSGRGVVFRLAGEGHLEILQDARVPLRPARDLSKEGRINPAAIDRTVEAVSDFSQWRAVPGWTGSWL